MQQVHDAIQTTKCDKLENLLKLQHNDHSAETGVPNYGLPGFHALDVITHLNPCLEDVKKLAVIVNTYMGESKKSNAAYYNGFKKLFKTMHMLRSRSWRECFGSSTSGSGRFSSTMP